MQGSIFIFSYGLGLEALGSDEDNGVPLIDEEIAGSVDILGESHCLYSSFLCVYYRIFLLFCLGHIPARFLPVVGGRLGQLTATVRIGEVVAADAAGLDLSRRGVDSVNLSHDGITGGAEGGEVLEKGGGRAGHLGRSWLVMHLL
jgi:hypothetical protein